MHLSELSRRTDVHKEFVEALLTAFWVRIRHHAGTAGIIELLQFDGDEDVAVFEQQCAIALGFTDYPEVI